LYHVGCEMLNQCIPEEKTSRQAYCITAYVPVMVLLKETSRGMRWHEFSVVCKRGMDNIFAYFFCFESVLARLRVQADG